MEFIGRNWILGGRRERETRKGETRIFSDF